MQVNRIIFFLLLAFVIFKLPTIAEPLVHDELSLVDASVRLLNTGIIAQNSTYVGHVPLVNYALTVLIGILGWSLAVPHLLSIAYALVALCFTYLIVRKFSCPANALLTTILVAVTPLFFTQAGILNLDMPATAMLLGFVYFLLCKRWFLASFFASLSSLTKETTLVVIALAILWLFLTNLQNPIAFAKNRWYLTIPFVLVFLWFFFCKAKNGWFISPGHAFFLLTNPEGFNGAIRYVFIENWRLILIPFFLIWRKNRPVVLLLLAIAIGGALFGGLIFKVRYLLPLIPIIYIAFGISIPKHWVFSIIWLILTIVAITSLFPNIFDPSETSMGYLNAIHFYKMGFEELDREYPNQSLLSPWPHTEQAKSPLWGYTRFQRPVFSVLEKIEFLPDVAISSSLQDRFITLYNPFLKKYYFPVKTVYFMGENFTIHKKI